jgi:CheY-like chemotaxis protein
VAPLSDAPTGLLFVDDEPQNISILVEILSDSLDEPVLAVGSVEAAVEALHARHWRGVVMDVFIPLGDHPNRVLGPRATSMQDDVDHLGGLILLEEIDRLHPRPVVMAHTACTDHALLEIFGDRVVHRIPKPAPLDTVLRDVMEHLLGHGS